MLKLESQRFLIATGTMRSVIPVGYVLILRDREKYETSPGGIW